MRPQGVSLLSQFALAAARRSSSCAASQPGLLNGSLPAALFQQQQSSVARDFSNKHASTSASSVRGFAQHHCAQCGSTTAASTSHREYHATTILCIRKDGQLCMVGDGQVSMGSLVAKPNAKKIRRIGETVVAGFAGSAADGLSLLERLEAKLEEHPEQLMRSAVELAKMWRQDKALRFLQAEILVADKNTTLVVSGNGDVLEPHDGVMGIGSGSPFATAAARALMDSSLDARAIAEKSMKIASDMCVFTNANFLVEVLEAAPPEQGKPSVLAPGADMNPISSN